MMSPMLMGGSTFLIGLLPTVADMVGLRRRRCWPRAAAASSQGFGVGGEWGGAVLMVCEYGDFRNGAEVSGPAGRRRACRRATCWPRVLRACSAVQSERTTSLAWGPLAGAVPAARRCLIPIGYWVRSTLAESPVFEKAVAERGVEAAPVFEAIKRRPGGIGIGMGLRIGENTTYYVITAFSITYITEVVHLRAAHGAERPPGRRGGR